MEEGGEGGADHRHGRADGAGARAHHTATRLHHRHRPHHHASVDEACLPGEVLVCVFAQLTDPRDLNRLAQVSRRWKLLSETDSLWRDLFRRRFLHHHRRQRQPHGLPTTSDSGSGEEEEEEEEEEAETEADESSSSSFEDFVARHKPSDLNWKSFYLRQVRGPVEQLLNALDGKSISLFQLSKLRLGPKSSAASAGPTPPAQTPQADSGQEQATTEALIKELLNLSRSVRLQEALAAYPRACREHLEVLRESVVTRLNFLRRVRMMIFLGKLGAVAYLIKRFVPSLYPLPSTFLTTRPTLPSVLRFWPLYAYTAVYYVFQRLIGRKDYLDGSPKWYFSAAKFANHTLNALLEETGLRWLCINPLIISIVLADGFLKGGLLLFALCLAYIYVSRIIRARHQGWLLECLNGFGVGMALAYYTIRSAPLRRIITVVIMPLFHYFTRGYYREAISKGDNAKLKYFELYVLGVFTMNSFIHFVSHWNNLKRIFAAPSLTQDLRSAFFPPPSISSLFSTSGLTSQLQRLRLGGKRVAVLLSHLLGMAHGNLLGWVMCHAAIIYGLPTVLVLKLLYEVEVLLLHFATSLPRAAYSRVTRSRKKEHQVKRSAVERNNITD